MDLFECNASDALRTCDHGTVTISRIQRLLSRDVALGFSLQKWERVGLWVVSRADAAYPSEFKRRLGKVGQVILLGCGNLDLLNERGVAVVGARDANSLKIEFAQKVG